MAWSHIASTGQNNGTGTTSAIDTTGADFLVALLTTVNNPTPTDSKSNTGWTGKTVQTGAFAGAIRIWWCVPTSVGSGHTLSVPGGNTPGLFFYAFSGGSATPSDQENGTSTPAQPTVQPGSITPSEDGCLVMVGCGVFSTAVATIASPYTTPSGLGLAGAGGSSWGGTFAYNIQTTATATNPVCTSGNTDSIVAVIASFKSAGGGGGGGADQPTMRRWGGVPFMGGQGVGNAGSGSGRMWGRTRDGLIVPRRLAA